MDIYRFSVCNEQGHLFEIFWGIPYETEELVQTFMNGDIAEGMDDIYNHYQWAGEAYIFEEFLHNNPDAFIPKTKVYDKEALYWMGYIYRYWHLHTGETSKEIYKQAPFKVMCDHYFIYHTCDPKLAISNLKELYEHRKAQEAEQTANPDDPEDMT